jgi:parallel beta-helix repeat protein
MSWEYDNDKKLYYAPSPCSNVQTLFVDGKEKKASRYPNNGYLIVKNSPSKSKFSLENFNMTNSDIKDSIAHIRMSSWRLASRRVKNYEDNYINLESNASSDNNITSKYKVFFSQVLGAIDKNEEWAWNANKIYMKSNNIPKNVTVACSEYGIYLDKKAKNVEINGLKITKIKGDGITKKYNTRKNTNDDIIIKNNNISYVSGWGISLQDFYKHYERLPADTIITRNEVHHARTGGIKIFADNALIDSNYVHDIGASKLDDDVLSYGDSYMLSGIYVENSSGAKVSNNRIDKVGYNGISLSNFWAGEVVNGDRIVENNYITNAVLALNDGGCIYTRINKIYNKKEEGREVETDIIRNNIMKNCIGSYAGITPEGFNHRAGEGIYLDDLSSSVDVYDNTVIGATKSLYLHNAYDINVSENTFISPDTVSIFLSQGGKGGADRENVWIKNNKILSGDKLTYQTIYNDGQKYLTDSDLNTIRIDSETDVKIKDDYDDDAYIEFSEWKGYGYDEESTIIKDSTQPVILINPSLNNRVFSNLEGCKKFDNTLLDNTSKTLEPYASLVLFNCTNYTSGTYEE